MAVSFNADIERVLKIIIIISFVVVVIVLAVGGFLWYRRSRFRKFDMTPRDRNQKPIGNGSPEDEDEEYEDDFENDPSEAPIYDDDVTYDEWQSWQDFLQEVGLIDIRDGMLEFETGDNSRMFIMLAEMGQSNPYLKTDEELDQNNMVLEVFLNGVQAPLKESSQSQKVEMTDYLNELREHSQFLHNSNDKMKQYAAKVIDSTLQYQRATDRFENKVYLQFLAIIRPDEVSGDTPLSLERDIHEKAYEKLVRQITRANGLLRRADHPLSILDNFGLAEVLYKTFNRESSVRIRFEDIVKNQNFALYTAGKQNTATYKKIQQMIQAEAHAYSVAFDTAMEETKARNEQLLKNGKDYYDDSSDESEISSSNDYEGVDIDELSKLD